MSHQETKTLKPREAPPSLDRAEKKLKELKEFSRLLIILSVAFITVSSSLYGFKEDVFSLYMLVVVIQLFALYFGVRFHKKYLLVFTRLNSWDQVSTSEEADEFVIEMHQEIDNAISWCVRQERSFLLSFAILLLAPIPWEKLVYFAWQSLPFITK